MKYPLSSEESPFFVRLFFKKPLYFSNIFWPKISFSGGIESGLSFQCINIFFWQQTAKKLQLNGLVVKTYQTELSRLSACHRVLFYGSRLFPLHHSLMSQDSVTNVNMMCTEQKRTPVAQAEANRKWTEEVNQQKITWPSLCYQSPWKHTTETYTYWRMMHRYPAATCTNG